MNNDTPISVLILAGGQGSRMGGVDKGLVEFRGKPLVEYALQTAGNSDDIIISCNRNLDAYDAYNVQLVSDVDKEYPGPLAGVQQGLHHAVHSLMLVLPCDTPCLPDDLLPRLLSASTVQPDAICIAHDGERDQPLHALIPAHLASSLDAYLTAGKRSVLGWYEQHEVIRVDFADTADSFININRMEELKGLEKQS